MYLQVDPFQQMVMTTLDIHDERLRQAIRVLREVIALKRPFNMRSWVDLTVGGDVMDCGSAACAVGWCCRDQWMMEQGLWLSPSGIPAFLSTYDFGAVMAFFGLSIGDACLLFHLEGYKGETATPEMVIERIETVLAERAA